MTNPTQPDITLYGGGPQFGLPENSPYVIKAEVQLQLAGLAYVKTLGRREDSPKGQLPYMDLDGERIADSYFIRERIERQFGVDLDAGLTPKQRAVAWALERMVENHFSWMGTYFRFLKPANFAKGPATWFNGAPEAIRDTLQADLLKAVSDRLFHIGLTRHDDAEILSQARRSLDALAAQLGDQPYLMGDHPTSVDAVTFGALAGILTPYFDSPLRTLTESYPTLVAYERRMMARFYPDHLQALAA